MFAISKFQQYIQCMNIQNTERNDNLSLARIYDENFKGKAAQQIYSPYSITLTGKCDSFSIEIPI